MSNPSDVFECRWQPSRWLLRLYLSVQALALLGEHLPCQRVMTCNNITFAREATLAGAGICGLPVMISEGAVRSGRLVELLPEARLPVGEV